MTQETFGKGKIREEKRNFTTSLTFTKDNYFNLKKIVKVLSKDYEGFARKKFTSSDLFEVFLANYDQFSSQVEKLIKKHKKTC